jgi:hypothetical protein
MYFRTKCQVKARIEDSAVIKGFVIRFVKKSFIMQVCCVLTLV